MAKYYGDVSTTTGWSERWATTEGALTSNVSPTRLTITKSSELNEYGVSLSSVDSDADRNDSEVLAKVRFNAQAPAGVMVGIFARGSGVSGAESFVYCALALANGDGSDYRPYVGQYKLGVNTFLGSVTLQSNMEDTWYWLKLRVEGTSVKAKAWLDTENEPGAWAVDTTTTVSGDGWVGVLGKDTATDPYDFAYFAVATAGDSLDFSMPNVVFVGI